MTAFNFRSGAYDVHEHGATAFCSYPGLGAGVPVCTTSIASSVWKISRGPTDS
jgi:hypothetical protein